MLFFESQNTLLWVGLSVTAGAFIVQISAQQLIAVILAVIGAFAGAGMAIAWALYGLLRRKPQ